MPIITLSRQMGARAELIIARVHKRLSLTVIDRATVGRAAIAAGVPEVVFEELTYEGQRTLVQRMLEFMGSLPGLPEAPASGRREPVGPLRLPFGGVLTTGAPPVVNTRAAMERYVGIVSMVVRDLAAQGNVLIVGRGGQAILRNDPRTLHVQIIAAFEDRVRRLMERDGIHRGEALRRLRASDEARASYLQRYYGINWLDPENYHLTLNTSRLSVEGAVEAIVAAARGLDAECDVPAGTAGDGW